MNQNYYKSGGALPVVIGSAAVLIGLVSVVTSFGNGSAIINTGGGNGANAVVSILAVGIGLAILKNRNTLSAVLFALLVGSLIWYGNYKVDAKRTVDVVVAAGSAAASSAGTAVTAATHSATNHRQQAHQSQSNSSGLKGGHRWLAAGERQWCLESPLNKNSLACKTQQCAINKCGPVGK